LDENVGRPLYLEIGHFIFACENAIVYLIKRMQQSLNHRLSVLNALDESSLHYLKII